MSLPVRRRQRHVKHKAQSISDRRGRLVRPLRVEALEDRRLLAVTDDLMGPGWGGGSDPADLGDFSPDIWISAPGKQPWPLGSDYTRSAESASIKQPTQMVAFDPFTRTEYVAPFEPINALDGELISAAQSAGFAGVDDMLASLQSPGGFMDDGSFEVNDDRIPSQKGSGSGVGSRNVHGNDDRVRIDDTLQYPWRAIGRLQITFPNGASGHCSGAMIGTYHFLTAGHCVHSQDDGGWATGLKVSLAQDLNDRFYGEADWSYVRSYTGWTADESPDHDWALITLDRNVGSFSGWLGYEWRGSDADYNGMTVNTAGYPGDLESGRAMYWANGPTTNATTNRVFYSGNNGMDTAGGQSGSAVWRYDAGADARYINVVHAYGGTTQNSGTRINQEKFDSLQTWKTEDNSQRPPTDRPDLIDYDRWYQTDFAGFSPNTVSPGNSFSVTSYPRNNGTASAGQFTVRYRLSANDVYDTSDYFLGDVEVSSVDALNWIDATLDTTLPQIPAGQYYVVWSIDALANVTEFLENNNTGKTSTRVTVQASANDVGDTLNTAAATNVGPASGTHTRTTEIGDGVHGTRDVDMYRFQAEAGSAVVLTTAYPGSGTSMDTLLRLFDANGTELAFNDDSVSLYSQIQHTFSAAGIYYVGVSGYPNNVYDPATAASGDPGSTGVYTLTIDLSTANNDIGDTLATATVTGLGPNSGTYTNATLIGDGSHTTRDVDIYQFQASAGSSLILTTTLPSGGTSMDTMLQLFDADSNSLVINDDNGGPYSRIEYTFSTSGVFYVAVSGYPNISYSPLSAGSGDPGSVGDYEIDIELNAPPGEIRGFKWHDLDRNLSWDQGEPALPGWEIYLDLNLNGAYDGGEPLEVTAADGSYAFTGLAVGTYVVGEVMQEGWVQTYPGEGSSEIFDSGAPYSPLDRSISAAADLSQYDAQTLANTSQWVVQFVDGFLATSEATRSLAASIGASVVSEAKYLSNSQIWEFSKAAVRVAAVKSLYSLAAIETFYPLVLREYETRAIPDDPLFNNQWHLRNTGQSGGTANADANVDSAWDIALGTGVNIAIVDDGLQYTHPDLAAHYASTLSWDFNGNDADPLPTAGFGHGTSAAGVAAAAGNNGIGVSGAAPNANLSGIRLIAGGVSDATEADALTFQYQGNDIYSNSWGPSDSGTIVEGPGPITAAALQDGVTTGRNGLGSIYVWAAGNGLENFDNVNYDGYANSRYTIAVSAIDHDGRQSYYSEPGAPILVAAYSSGDSVGITTTDLLGNDGYSTGDYTSSFGGTSSATPLVAGVIALMLEANPGLTWRDVQHILVQTASHNDASDPDWTLNGAGHLVNHKYGFGAIDAAAAVALAQNWNNVASETTIASGNLAVNQAIPDDDPSGILSSFTIDQNIQIESVEVVFNATHTYRGDLQLVLTSPSGTQSVLSELHNDGGDNYNWVFTSLRHWGEASSGEWTLSVVDGFSGDSGIWNSWEIVVHGSEAILSGVHYVTVAAGQVVNNVNFGNKLEVNQPPTAVRLENVLLEINENTQQAARLKVADIVIDDDGAGDNELSLSGTQAADFEIDGLELFLRAGTLLDFESLAALQIMISVDDTTVGATPDASENYTLTVLDLAELTNVTVGDGTTQHSLVDQLVITFDGEVDIDSGAFTIQRRALETDAGGVVTSSFSTQIINGMTVATVTFSGSSTRGGGALIDGNYELQLDASKITRGGMAMDGDRNGVSGGDFEYGTDSTDAFFAMFGDLDGDRQVSLAEFNAFRSAFGKNSTQPGYSRALDFDGDNIIGLSDFNQFRNRFGKRLLFA